VIVECARCGDKYDNPTAVSQLDADGRLAVCPSCEREIDLDVWSNLPDDQVPTHAAWTPDHPDDFDCERCGRNVFDRTVHQKG